MVFSLDALDLGINKIIVPCTLRELCSSFYYSPNSIAIDSIKGLTNLSKKDIISKLSNCYMFYHQEESIYRKFFVGAFDEIIFLNNFRSYFKKDFDLGLMFISCFYESEQTILEFAKAVEEILKPEENNLSFVQYKEVYQEELKEYLKNYKIIKKEA